MRMKSQWILLFAGVAVLCLVGWGSGGSAQGAARANWEYTVFTSYGGINVATSDVASLNKLGGEGWELVMMREDEPGRTPRRTDYYLKRAR
ncbi:MAG: hypothetical protein QOG71_1347 [Pyrinomonadaceae bacterium]|nr:hypothetical protein [Pyrinomonadaceae bacterium]